MIGLSTYAFMWRLSDRVSRPLSLTEAIEQTREAGVSVFQVCDYPPLETMSDDEVASLASVARELDVTLELGTKGIEPPRLARFLDLAIDCGASLVRSMIAGPRTSPTTEHAAAWLQEAMPAYEAAGVTLALETYEQVPTAALVALAERLDSTYFGICLDPGNVVGRLEHPRACVETAAPWVKNVHVKDFRFERQEGLVGFTFSGAPMGTGQLDYDHLRATVKPAERGINEIVEHWLTWQGDASTTVAVEQEWTARALDHLVAAA